MIKIRIGEVEKELAFVDEQWINQQINRRKKDNQAICVRVVIEEGNLNMALSTPTCTSRGVSGRHPNSQEKEIFELWEKRGLNEPDFNGGNLISFLKQLRNSL